jgi:hypothetical protein
MKWPRRIAAFLACGLVLAALPAAACTVEADYRVPGNLEQAHAAETIVLARVVGATPDAESQTGETLTIRPLLAIKGPLPQGDIGLRGMALARGRFADLGMLSNPYEFERAHPASYLGACIRTVFPLGTTALFFLRTDHEGMWAPAAEPFTRWAEDVPGEDAPWVELVRFYVRAASLADAERIALLENEMERQGARKDDALAQLVAADVQRQLSGPSAARQDGTLGNDDFRDRSESAVEAALKAMRQQAEE